MIRITAYDNNNNAITTQLLDDSQFTQTRLPMYGANIKELLVEWYPSDSIIKDLQKRVGNLEDVINRIFNALDTRYDEN